MKKYAESYFRGDGFFAWKNGVYRKEINLNQEKLFKEKKPKKCSSCGAAIKFVKTIRGKWMPCDPEGFITEGGETIITADGHTKKNCEPGHFGFIPHWHPCPDAEKHRKGKK